MGLYVQACQANMATALFIALSEPAHLYRQPSAWFAVQLVFCPLCTTLCMPFSTQSSFFLCFIQTLPTSCLPCPDQSATSFASRIFCSFLLRIINYFILNPSPLGLFYYYFSYSQLFTWSPPHLMSTFSLFASWISKLIFSTLAPQPSHHYR